LGGIMLEKPAELFGEDRRANTRIKSRRAAESRHNSPRQSLGGLRRVARLQHRPSQKP
jgi:hypothetical protein